MESVVFLVFCCMNVFSRSESAASIISMSGNGNETDRLALLAFKDAVTSDPLGALTSWNHTLHMCEWQGVTCSSNGRHDGRVQLLNLHSNGLVGSLSPHIGNLSFLKEINLQNNSFYGHLPPQLGRLFRLQKLNLGNNSFGGVIPTNLSRCSDLSVINFIDNKLVGEIPTELSSLSKLVQLYLPANYLTGTIPPSLGNLSSLTHLSLARNDLEGSIPEELSRITGLGFLQISQNRLSGTVPPSLYNLSSIYFFVVAENDLHGRLPPHLGLSLPNLRVFLVGGNGFFGSIPTSLPNASGLVLLDFAFNNLSGPVPMNLGSLQRLSVLNFVFNQLGGGRDDLSFITPLTNCSLLEVLALSSNQFKGVIPNSITNLSTHLTTFMMGRNQIYGSIPTGIDNLVNLTRFVIQWNGFTGMIPDSIGKLSKLQVLGMTSNGLSGQIPSSLGNLTMLNTLYLDVNNLHGSIPATLGNCQNLQALDLSVNNLTGSVPLSLGNCPNLLELDLYHNQISGYIPKQVLTSLSSLSISLNLAHNSLTGTLPLEVGNLKNLERLDISENRLSGEIPSTLSDCISLQSLRMEGNLLQGSIPPSLSTLRAIEVLDLSRNNFSGHIPRYLAEFSFLQNLNLSFNNLEGQVPIEGIFGNASAVSFRGNSKLCGGIPELKLPACRVQASKKRRWSLALKITIPTITAVLCLLLCIASNCWLRKFRNKTCSSMASMGNLHAPPISYAQLFKATNGFSSDNLFGEGNYGSVYKGILDCPETTTVAVKVFNLARTGASKSFLAECEALRNIRHRNLVKIVTSCSSLDFNGNDFKALVFQFMSNGSLESWLHPEDELHQLRKLSFIQRLDVAIGVASALDYLHHRCQTPIIHCDLKPSNILLDDDMNAHVGDFGLARFIHETCNNSSSIVIKGTLGYVAPEYGLSSQLSTMGDVYSYGILLLEMFTGKCPTDEMFKDGQSLHELARMSLPERVREIVDPRLLSEVEETSSGNGTYNSMRIGIELFTLIIRAGVACSTESPRERMEMKDVVVEMQVIKDLLFRDENRIHKQTNLKPTN